VARTYGSGGDVATMVRARIRADTGLTASIGVASTKFLAKLVSDMAKPDGLLVVAAGTEVAFLDPLPVQRCWGVGPATLRTLERMGVHTIGDLARLDEPMLVGALGDAHGRHLYALARNDDDRAVEPVRETKSIGAEETFDTDLHARADCEREVVRLADRATTRLRTAGLVARTVTLKVRFGDFETKTRARTLREHTDLTATVATTARALLEPFAVERGIRLLGVSLSQLTSADAVQQAFALDSDDENAASDRERHAALDRATDAVRARFGNTAVKPAVLLEREDP
jgi:DNA polymerase-4